MMIYPIPRRNFLPLFICYIMEILILVLFYYLAQNPDFSKSVQPLMEKLKDSQEMLNFLKDLSKFTQAFGNIDPSAFTNSSQKASSKQEEKSPTSSPHNENPQKQEEKNPQSPTQGIADEFIQNILESYLNKTAPQ